MATPQGPAPTAPALVGRERELAALRAALAAALAGRGSLVLIGGEAGIGKTTLAEVALAEAQQQGALVLVGRSYDLAETPVLATFAIRGAIVALALQDCPGIRSDGEGSQIKERQAGREARGQAQVGSAHRAALHPSMTEQHRCRAPQTLVDEVAARYGILIP